MKKYIVGLLLLFISINGFTQTKKEATIHSSVVCDDCRERIEGVLNYTKGVKFAEVDLESKNVLVKYNSKKISLEEIKKIITSIGYDADEMTAQEAAVEKLPACCKPGGMD